MSTLRINNIEAQSIPASPTLDEKVKITNSSGDILVNIDGKTSGITTIGINTTDGNIKFDENSNVVVTGIVTATKFSGDFEPVHVNASGIITASSFVGTGVSIVGVVTATSFVGSGANLTNLPDQSFDDDKIVNDISILALKVSALENSAASNTNSTYVDTFQDSAGISNFTTSGRHISGEYISSVYDAITNISAGWKGGQSNNTGTDANGASSYTGIDGVTRSTGQIVGNNYFPNYNGFCLGYVFGASDNFEVIFSQRGSWQAGGRIHGSGLPSTISSSIGTFRTEPPSSLSTTFTSHASNLTMAGGYPLPIGSNFDGTMFYRYYRDNGTVTCSYTQSVSDVSFDATRLAALRASTNYLGGNSSGFGRPTTINDKMLIITGEGGTTQFIKIEMVNTFAEATSATGSVTSVTINAPSTISKMGVIVTYIDHAGTATLNTDLKIYLSANNGSNFTQATLVAMPNFATGVKMAKANDVTISNTGTQLKWKVEFANQASGSKETRVTGISLQY